MHRNQELYTFLKGNSRNLTEEWHENIDKQNTAGVYASSDPDVVHALKEQNHEFHLHFIELFKKEEGEFFKDFKPWIEKIASDVEHVKTPIQFVIREFKNVRNQYFDYIRRFAELHPEIARKEVDIWYDIILKEMDEVILRFIEATYRYSQGVLKAQQETINELSAPVISLTNHQGLLPLIGDIDTTRAKMILENTLQQCSQRDIHHLFVDLSGVAMIDTMVAHQIFQLLNALKLIGVNATLSGMRPEIAQTAVQLGISFKEIDIKTNLAQAIDQRK
ncbi:STAS domain-containing protein [Bacillus sp. ISL-35]|uniref:STAS domain-containing protein n=1 Tax=Bacillus sp. ISL-35 TaxID=2819122 RepID=UPI001BE9176D|nr:STAS domain-containing protein [Bacillus sp. ISL-35]MBT2681030.1 STAS domain-containing protein [Bacillus sp. ISL-35]MBT2705349.1 STAS domain-containing protein [Chryseobacterium sp. ISL-80]